MFSILSSSLTVHRIAIPLPKKIRTERIPEPDAARNGDQYSIQETIKKRFFDPEASATPTGKVNKMAEMTMLRATEKVKKEAPWRWNPKNSIPFPLPPTTVAKC